MEKLTMHWVDSCSMRRRGCEARSPELREFWSWLICHGRPHALQKHMQSIGIDISVMYRCECHSIRRPRVLRVDPLARAHRRCCSLPATARWQGGVDEQAMWMCAPMYGCVCAVALCWGEDVAGCWGFPKNKCEAEVGSKVVSAKFEWKA
jgi:hypothetical protein